MSELNKNNFTIFLNNIQKQFLCCYPIQCIAWEDFPKDLTWEQQKIVMDFTYNSSLNKQFPIKLGYQLNFLKKLLNFLEKNSDEVHDTVYESFCHLQQNLAKDCTEEFAFKHYIVKPGIECSLRESKSFVAKGTTGLCSWQASLAMADFLIVHPCIIRDKSILELGAGTGLCGFLILKMCQPRHLLLSDGSPPCVELMCENMKRNFSKALQETDHRFRVNTQIVEFAVIPWDSIDFVEGVNLLKPDIILAADVVYDDSCFKDLSSAIDYVFKLKKNCVEMYLAATVRTNKTINKFLAMIASLDFNIREYNVVDVEKSHLYWDRSTPVKIFKITR